jgi:hypothetical protein
VKLIPEKLLIETTGCSESARQYNDAWDPIWTVERFVALAVCDNCGDPTALAGVTNTEESPPDDEEESRWRTYLIPRFVQPPPVIVPRPRGTPTSIKDLLTKAEGLFWTDLGAAGNAIRCVIEELLTEQGIRRFTINKKRKRQMLPLHARIEDFSTSRNGPLGDKMQAVKWLGNAGSHGVAVLDRESLFDGFDLLHHVLEEVYTQKTRTLDGLAKRITPAKGPSSRTKRKS